MSNFNKAILIGYVTRDLELKETQSKQSVVSFSIGVTRKKEGGTEETLFMPITAWGKQAIACAKFLRKGSKILAEGFLAKNEWEKDGVKQEKIFLNATTIEFLDTKGAKPEETSDVEPF